MLDTLKYKHTLRICNNAFPRQRWLRERASVLYYTTLSVFFFFFPGNAGCVQGLRHHSGPTTSHACRRLHDIQWEV
jgi:hypothetical protein